MIVKTKIVNWFKAGAITVWPFIFVHPDLSEWQPLLRHEGVHLEQQKRWAKWGLVVPGLLAWYFLYLLVLPVGWNYFRKKWETEAMTVEGLFKVRIDEMLKQPPYYLWWM